MFYRAFLHSEAFQTRVAKLLDVTPTYDAGQPIQLALGNFPSQDVMVAQAAQDAVEPQVAVADTQSTELAAVDADVVSTLIAAPARPEKVAAAEQVQVAYAPTPQVATARVVSNPVVQELPANYQAAGRKPASRWAANTSQRPMAATSNATDGTHLDQLGSF